MLVKFIGVLSSAYAWNLLLIGQGIRFPYWQKIVTSFLIGRFIGTFLPSTIGLDGYTLYEAGRYSNQWPRAITAKGLKKFIGVTGLFLGMVVTLPFGYSVIENVMAELGKPEAASTMAAAILIVAGGISSVVTIGLIKPGLLQWGLGLFGKFTPGAIRAKINEFVNAVGAYEGKVGILMLALANKFVTHFTTAVVYFFTALAIGVVGAEFWPVVFGSTIQICSYTFVSDHCWRRCSRGISGIATQRGTWWGCTGSALRRFGIHRCRSSHIMGRCLFMDSKARMETQVHRGRWTAS